MPLATQKSGIVQSDLSATRSNQISDFESQLSQPNKIDIMTPELARALDRAKEMLLTY